MGGGATDFAPADAPDIGGTDGIMPGLAEFGGVMDRDTPDDVTDFAELAGPEAPASFPALAGPDVVTGLPALAPPALPASLALPDALAALAVAPVFAPALAAGRDSFGGSEV